MKLQGIKLALIDDAKTVDVAFNKYTSIANDAASKAYTSIDTAIKNLSMAMLEADKARKLYKEIEKSTAALGLKPTDVGYSILVNEVIMDSGQWQDLLDTLKIAKSKLDETAFF